jgi:hypothetical protein
MSEWTVWEGGQVWDRVTRTYSRPPDKVIARVGTKYEADALIGKSPHKRWATPNKEK